jgi:predicted RNase H-like nuclease (RuvC/YqgF family)
MAWEEIPKWVNDNKEVLGGVGTAIGIVWASVKAHQADKSKQKAEKSEAITTVKATEAGTKATEANKSARTVEFESQILRDIIDQERTSNLGLQRLLDETQQQNHILLTRLNQADTKIERLEAEIEKMKKQLAECKESNARIANRLSENTKGKSRGLPGDEGAWRAGDEVEK